jgi:hypothetical protein
MQMPSNITTQKQYQPQMDECCWWLRAAGASLQVNQESMVCCCCSFLAVLAAVVVAAAAAAQALRPKLSEEQQHQLEECFELMDADGSGAIDADELSAAFKVC